MWFWITASLTHEVIALYVLSILYFILGSLATHPKAPPYIILLGFSLPAIALFEILRGNIQGKKGPPPIWARALLIVFLPIGIVIGSFFALIALTHPTIL